MPDYYKCRVDLSDDDRMRLGKELAEAMCEKARIEYEKTCSTRRYKNLIAEQDSRAARASEALRDGYEMREVEVKLVRDADAGVMRTVRVDTGECVHTRYLETSDVQAELPLEPGQEPPLPAVSEHPNDSTPQPLGATALWEEWVRLWMVSPDDRKTSHKKLRKDWSEFAGDRAELVDPIERFGEMARFGMLPTCLQGLEVSKSSINIILAEAP